MKKTQLLARQDPPVFIQGDEAYITSLTIAKHTKKPHKTVLRIIDTSHASPGFSRRNFAPRDYTDSRGKSQRMIVLTEQGLIRVVMKLTGPDVAPFQDWVSEEFVRMRDEIKRVQRQQATIDWQLARKEITDGRKTWSDTVKLFVEYAKAQGSGKPEMYYMNITKAEHKALFIVEEETGVPLRDRLDAAQLGALTVAERIADKALREGMDAGLHYKAVFVLARDRVIEFASLIGKSRVDDGRNDPPSLNA